MRDINKPLARSYFDRLNGNVIINSQPVKLYRLFVPQGHPDYYILIQGVSSVGIETKNDQDRNTSIQLVFYSRKDLNGATELQSMVDQALQLVYPYRGFAPDGCLSMDLVSDNEIGDIDPATSKQIIERIITFKHIITS